MSSVREAKYFRYRYGVMLLAFMLMLVRPKLASEAACEKVYLYHDVHYTSSVTNWCMKYAQPMCLNLFYDGGSEFLGRECYDKEGKELYIDYEKHHGYVCDNLLCSVLKYQGATFGEPDLIFPGQKILCDCTKEEL